MICYRSRRKLIRLARNRKSEPREPATSSPLGTNKSHSSGSPFFARWKLVKKLIIPLLKIQLHLTEGFRRFFNQFSAQRAVALEERTKCLREARCCRCSGRGLELKLGGQRVSGLTRSWWVRWGPSVSELKAPLRSWSSGGSGWADSLVRGESAVDPACLSSKPPCSSRAASPGDKNSDEQIQGDKEVSTFGNLNHQQISTRRLYLTVVHTAWPSAWVKPSIPTVIQCNHYWSENH